MKKKDIILIIGLLVVIGIGYFIFEMMQGEKDVIEIYYHNEVIEKIDISIDKTYIMQSMLSVRIMIVKRLVG